MTEWKCDEFPVFKNKFCDKILWTLRFELRPPDWNRARPVSPTDNSYISDACLRCQAENKQDDCVGMFCAKLGRIHSFTTADPYSCVLTVLLKVYCELNCLKVVKRLQRQQLQGSVPFYGSFTGGFTLRQSSYSWAKYDGVQTLYQAFAEINP